MNVEATPAPESITRIASPEQLVGAREARGWSRSDIAAKLGMMPRQIDAIEQGRWEALPGNAFVRGAIRAYGKALQLDVAPLLAALGAQANAPELRPSSSLDSPLPRHGALGFDNGGSGSRIVWILLGVIGVIAIAMYFGRGADLGQVLEPGRSGSTTGRSTVDVVPVVPGASSGSDVSDVQRGSATAGSGAGAATPAAPSAVPQPAGSAAVPAPSAGAPAAGATAGVGGSDGSAGAGGASGSASSGMSGGASSGGASAAVLGEASAASPTSAATSSAGTAAPGSGGASADAGRVGGVSGAAATPASAGAASAGAPPAAAGSVVMHFERESWVDVRDANGKVLLMGTQPANSTREVSGQKPYSLTIGNAAFVRIEHAGRDVDLGTVTQKGVARVRIE
ncbi:MAG: DUF4115 domain-containing protein [Burkholderiaceae bacterium]|nr:DUF4115 domain-containing protein [Burkholderiaceae bacterium]